MFVALASALGTLTFEKILVMGGEESNNRWPGGCPVSVCPLIVYRAISAYVVCAWFARLFSYPREPCRAVGRRGARFP